MKHLVLGSEGQIGKYVCDKIIEKGHELIEWDLVNGPSQDLRDSANLSMLIDDMRKADFVHFLAYDVGGARYLAEKQNNLTYIQNNIAIMDNVFAALEVTKTPFYFASTQMENMPWSMYGRLKGIGEGYAKALDGIVLRFWNVYGYERDPEKSHVITDFIKSALTTGTILCRTNGAESRNFSHASDIANILIYIAEHPEEYAITEDVWPARPEQDGVWDIVSREAATVPIARIAREIRDLIPGISIYFSDIADNTQRKEINKPELIQHMPHKLVLSEYSLWDGIADMVDRIKADIKGTGQ